MARYCVRPKRGRLRRDRTDLIAAREGTGTPPSTGASQIIKARRRASGGVPFDIVGFVAARTVDEGVEGERRETRHTRCQVENVALRPRYQRPIRPGRKPLYSPQ